MDLCEAMVAMDSVLFLQIKTKMLSQSKLAPSQRKLVPRGAVQPPPPTGELAAVVSVVIVVVVACRRFIPSIVLQDVRAARYKLITCGQGSAAVVSRNESRSADNEPG